MIRFEIEKSNCVAVNRSLNIVVMVIRVSIDARSSE